MDLRAELREAAPRLNQEENEDAIRSNPHTERKIEGGKVLFKGIDYGGEGVSRWTKIFSPRIYHFDRRKDKFVEGEVPKKFPSITFWEFFWRTIFSADGY